jgi:hypothetical protein
MRYVKLQRMYLESMGTPNEHTFPLLSSHHLLFYLSNSCFPRPFSTKEICIHLFINKEVFQDYTLQFENYCRKKF